MKYFNKKISLLVFFGLMLSSNIQSMQVVETSPASQEIKLVINKLDGGPYGLYNDGCRPTSSKGQKCGLYELRTSNSGEYLLDFGPNAKYVIATTANGSPTTVLPVSYQKGKTTLPKISYSASEFKGKTTLTLNAEGTSTLS